MLILDYPDWNQPTVAQVLIPEAAYRLSPELEKIDKLLQDESYEYPIVDRFNTQRGRPSIPVRVYIRMMFLKHYAGLSYEDLVPGVTHNLMYRFFCRIPIEQKVPDPTALMKRGCGHPPVSHPVRDFVRTPRLPPNTARKLLRT